MLRDILVYLWDRRTTVFGYVQVALGFMVATQGLFGEDTMRWLLFCNGLITALLGHYNNSQARALRDAGIKAQGGFARLGLVLMLLGAATMFLAACTPFLPAARSYDQKVAGAYATLAVVNDTAAVLRNADVISLGDAIEVRTKTREALTAVDLAAVLSPAEGGSQVVKALDLLRQAQDLLCANRPLEPNCQYLLQRTQL